MIFPGNKSMIIDKMASAMYIERRQKSTENLPELFSGLTNRTKNRYRRMALVAYAVLETYNQREKIVIEKCPH